jgi:hypothetical protein
MRHNRYTRSSQRSRITNFDLAKARTTVYHSKDAGVELLAATIKRTRAANMDSEKLNKYSSPVIVSFGTLAAITAQANSGPYCDLGSMSLLAVQFPDPMFMC